MSNESFSKTMSELENLFYEFEHCKNERNFRKREIRCLFARIRKGIKDLNEMEKEK